MVLGDLYRGCMDKAQALWALTCTSWAFYMHTHMAARPIQMIPTDHISTHKPTLGIKCLPFLISMMDQLLLSTSLITLVCSRCLSLIHTSHHRKHNDVISLEYFHCVGNVASGTIVEWEGQACAFTVMAQ